MAGIFIFIGFLGVLIGAAAAAVGLYQTFGETQAALDAWVAGAQVFFLGAMLMALGSVAARVKGTTRAVEELARAVRALRAAGEAEPARSPRRAPVLEEDELDLVRPPAPPRAAARPAVAEPGIGREPGGRERPGRLRVEPEPEPERGPVLGARGARPVEPQEPSIRPQPPRRPRLGPSLAGDREPAHDPERRPSRLRRPFDDE